ncbi:MAG: hypothetical protein NC099_06225 [Corallococcus sp.]|nr:hypothetical protein [Corallococcus sp.]
MTQEEYISALEHIKEMHAKVGDALGWLLGNLKGDLNKLKKIPRLHVTLR